MSLLIHTSFYRFVHLPAPEDTAVVLRELVASLTGVVVLANEGISGALAGTAEQLESFEFAIQNDDRLNGNFHGMVFKHSACLSKPFWRVRVHVKTEIVALGIEGVSGLVPDCAKNSHLSPEAWREMIAQEDVVVLDNRNSFEYRLGHFNNAIDPKVDNFRDFPSYVQAHAEQWKAQGKRIAMYCTGGIRCEKTAPWMQQNFGLEVYQLSGGIINYLQALPNAEKDWQGECFVFDNRVAVNTRLQETPRTVDEVYDPELDDERWRLERAKRLEALNPKKINAQEE